MFGLLLLLLLVLWLMIAGLRSSSRGKPFGCGKWILLLLGEIALCAVLYANRAMAKNPGDIAGMIVWWVAFGIVGMSWLAFWLTLGVAIVALFFEPYYVVIKEQGFRLEGAAIDLNPDRYKQPATLSVQVDAPLEIRNSTAHAVRVHPLRSNDPIQPAFSLQRPASASSATVGSAITLAAGQSGWLAFELGGDYDMTVHHLDGAAFPYDHLLVQVSAPSAAPLAVITDRGFLVANTIADLRAAPSPDSPQPAMYSIKSGSQVRFKNLTSQPVQLCLGSDGTCHPQAAGPAELRSGLTLAPDQSLSVTFDKDELAGDYDITVFCLDGTAFPHNHLLVRLSTPSATPTAVITDRGFLVANTIADLRAAPSPDSPQPAMYSIESGSQVRFKNLTLQPVQLCLGRDGICHPQAAGPEELRSGLTLAPGQSASVRFPTEGNYDLTCYAPGYPAFVSPNLVVQVSSSD